MRENKSYLEEFIEELKVKRSAFTKTDLPAKHHYIFGRVVSLRTFKKVENKVKNHKQVLVKLIGNMGAKRTYNALNYIIENSENTFVINEKGEEVFLEELMKDWSKNFLNRENSKEAWHLVFSLDEDYLTPKKERALKESVKDVMASHFFGHKYAFVIHKHQARPHVHVVLNKFNFLEYKRLHFAKKTDIKYLFDSLREEFALALSIRGMQYINRSPLEKNLEESIKKVQRTDRLLKADSQFGISTIYEDIYKSFNQKIKDKEQRVKALKIEFEEAKNHHTELQKLLEQYIRHQNKRKFILAKQIKEHGLKLKRLGKELIKESKELKRLNRSLDNSKNDLKIHTLSRFESSQYKRNFLRSYEKMYPLHKGASKKDIQNYYRVKKSLELETKEIKENVLLYSKNYYKDYTFENTNLFELEKKTKALNENIYILKNMDYFLKQESENYLLDLKKNLSYIGEIYKNRFKTIEKELILKGGKNNFLLREYSRGCEFLGLENKVKKVLSSASNMSEVGGRKALMGEKKVHRNLYEEIQQKYNNSQKNNQKQASLKEQNNNMGRSF
ncbi:relaxase/mobilization nuclease domain-containing protein [Campylobacter helveticus]|nr:hypothetical protein [Campylobacter helveticus]